MTKLLIISTLFFGYKRLLRYLQYFQQENYYNKRFFHWLIKKRAFDKRGSLIAITGGLFSSIFASIALALLTIFEKNPIKDGKLRLILTKRAWRIYIVAFSIYIILAIALSSSWFLQIIAFQMIPFCLIAANIILIPVERHIQKKILANAREKLKGSFVIGITGSYGKTSTKEILGQILQTTLGPTFWPSGGINTPMGISREVNTRLIPGTKYAIIEMGAYNRGSINRLCDLAPPHAGIITTIGKAHLERFGSEENIFRAKSELAKRVSKTLVCNGDDPGARKASLQSPKKLLYGFDTNSGDLDCFISKYSFSEKGSNFTLHWDSKEYEGFTPLLGKTALYNIMAAFTMACHLGSDPEYALAVIYNLKAVDNRLQIEEVDGITYLKDAYNSNPSGFKDALDMMNTFQNRKVLITPGMIELGKDQHKENSEIAGIAAKICDLIFFVGETNKDSFLSVPAEKITFFNSRDKALQEYSSIKTKGDAVLIENDLPDLYETKINL